MERKNRFEERYRRMADVQLREIALSGDLSREAQEALDAEFVRRGSGEAMMLAVEAQRTMDDPGKHMALVEIFRHRTCPSCNATAEPINAAYIRQVVSFIFVTLSKRHLMIACHACLNKELKSATAVTMFGGWWMIPFGPIRTIAALHSNRKNGLELEHEAPTQALLDFVKANAGRIVLEIEKNPDWIPKEWNDLPATIEPLRVV